MLRKYLDLSIININTHIMMFYQLFSNYNKRKAGIYMHNYSINQDYRKKSITIILIISYIINLFLYKSIDNIINFIKCSSEKLSCFIDSLESIGISVNFFTVLAIFTFLYWLFSKHLWKNCLISKLHNIPDLSGKWNGTLTSSYTDNNGNPTILNINVQIKQTWDKISIKCEFPQSSSNSKAASLYIDENQGDILTFTYINDANEPTWNTRMHEGCNILVHEGNTLRGRYFTNRDNGTHGTINLRKTQ